MALDTDLADAHIEVARVERACCGTVSMIRAVSESVGGCSLSFLPGRYDTTPVV